MVDKILWAKKSLGNDGNPKWLPLYQHLLDTKFVIHMLYRFYLSDHQRNIIKESLESSFSNSNEENLIQFIGITHDIGKATPAFQMKKSYQGIKDLDHTLLERLFNGNYLSADFMDYPLSYPEQSPHALAGEAILENFGVNDDIGSIIGGHHGKPIDHKNNNIDKFSMNYYFEEQSNNSVHKKWASTQKEFFDWSLSESGYSNVNEIPKIKTIAAQVIIEGLLVMSDWIASNENYFPLFDANQYESLNLDKRLEEGWRKWFKNPRWMPEEHDFVDEYYKDRFNFKPREFQSKIFNRINETNDPGIVIIESGMGSGKTEASLATVEQLAKKHGSDGIFYCLPTQATTNAMFARVNYWLEHLAKEDDENKDIQLVHGKAALNDDFAALPHSIDIGDENIDAGVMVNRWFLGSKTAILDDFVVGTVDQLLLLALKKKHLALRHLGFSSKVVVIDEAHGFDSYMQSYLCRALEWLGKYNVPVVILSATLPAKKRMEFMDAYLDKTDDNVNHKIKSNLSYPLVSYSDGNDIKTIDSFKPISRSKEIKINILDDNNLISKVQDLLSGGGVCGIVVNTVYRAQELGKELIKIFGKQSVEILHSSFIDTDRRVKETKLLNTIGKNNEERPKLKIVIGTQVLEQSLDIDFDVMITDLAPMDLILQRIGRLQRHSVNNDLRPEKLSTPKCYILGISKDYEYESGASYIYGDALLMRTQNYLKDTISLPSDISHLIQEVYDFDKDIDLPSELEDKYNKTFSEYKDNIKNERTAASTYMIDKYSNMHDDLIGWLNNPNEQDLEKSDAMGLAQVRDGEDSVEVIMVKSIGDNDYSLLSNDIPLKDSVLNGDYVVTKSLAENTIKLPNVLSKTYSIEQTIDELEKFNKDYLANWQEQSWLKGSLGIILDENNQFIINGHILTYDNDLGMMIDKEE
ncbi:CRISPR-associated helicase Cas3' [Apilactobacillus micheneri]|uniref:CRISPR-associated helicase Cas3 n=1 Tax=Apilactobacillus micheneri TaxID=1899430 RepID=A0A9Q8MTN4_9LACO|nr:CRISPR-associated helicase Cas3' [Apilactobacillus micheneri]TPR39920.1 CRISPR-associated helicase Cas3' [Apilactobacillus micheneri]TPR41735.1 CRISPR-associated helicase Cas3' [Apilactobacillus micheneri]TPR44122.1 CRISPR-associated helicase Cas3' [Apilactobacillus micheneri]TPR45746.1 CRISPR-associated helicase Cas3' [Apilactobacillus micheneri]TPR51503.1 CRISPR-associated helicase Cas3' [Apilactobacillus micheneri]